MRQRNSPPDESHGNEDPLTVSVKAFGGLGRSLGGSPIPIAVRANATVRDLLSALNEHDPDFAASVQAGLSDGYLHVLLNGRNIRFLDDLDTRLHDDDSVALVPPIGGG